MHQTEITVKVGNQIKRITITPAGTEFLWSPLTPDQIAQALIDVNVSEIEQTLRGKAGEVIDAWVSTEVQIAQ